MYVGYKRTNNLKWRNSTLIISNTVRRFVAMFIINKSTK